VSSFDTSADRAALERRKVVTACLVGGLALTSFLGFLFKIWVSQ